MVIFHELHLPVLGGDLQLQSLHLSMCDVVERLDRILTVYGAGIDTNNNNIALELRLY